MVIRFAKTGEIVILDYRSVLLLLPLKICSPLIKRKKRKWTQVSGLASGVPGTLLGLKTALDEYGTMALKEVMAPAIGYMEKGFE